VALPTQGFPLPGFIFVVSPISSLLPEVEAIMSHIYSNCTLDGMWVEGALIPVQSDMFAHGSEGKLTSASDIPAARRTGET
jgi:hypothetical protein